jgi:hypothetical protein
MENAGSINWEWDDLLDIISHTENENIRANILKDDVVIVEDYLKCKVGYKRNHKDLISGFLNNMNSGNFSSGNRSSLYNGQIEKRFKF